MSKATTIILTDELRTEMARLLKARANKAIDSLTADFLNPHPDDTPPFDMAEMNLADAVDLANIVRFIDKGELINAAGLAYYMDTAPREEIPTALYDSLMEHLPPQD